MRKASDLAERGVAGVAVAPPPPAAQPGGTPFVTWRPPGSPRERPAAPGTLGGHRGEQDPASAGVGIPKGFGARLPAVPPRRLNARPWLPGRACGQSGVRLALRGAGAPELPGADRSLWLIV